MPRMTPRKRARSEGRRPRSAADRASEAVRPGARTCNDKAVDACLVGKSRQQLLDLLLPTFDVAFRDTISLFPVAALPQHVKHGVKCYTVHDDGLGSYGRVQIHLHKGCFWGEVHASGRRILSDRCRMFGKDGTATPESVSSALRLTKVWLNCLVIKFYRPRSCVPLPHMAPCFPAQVSRPAPQSRTCVPFPNPDLAFHPQPRSCVPFYSPGFASRSSHAKVLRPVFRPWFLRLDPQPEDLAPRSPVQIPRPAFQVLRPVPQSRSCVPLPNPDPAFHPQPRSRVPFHSPGFASRSEAKVLRPAFQP